MSKKKEDFVGVTPAVPEVKRVFKNDRVVIHDLFKLLPAELKRNVSYTSIPRYEHIPHQHFFHSYDSNGVKQDACSPIGGHTHKIEMKEVNGKFELVIGPPCKKVRGKFIEIPHDKHTHDFNYIFSQEIKLRSYNNEAQAQIAEAANKAAVANQTVRE